MNFNLRVIFFSLVLIVGLPVGLLFYKYFNRPQYIPPPPRKEINITIIPGWNLRQIADDWIKKGLIKNQQELYVLTGEPATNYKAVGKTAPILSWTNTSTLAELFLDKPKGISYEGYFLPDTYRVYADAKPEEVIKKIFNILDDKITPEMRAEIKRQDKTVFEILTMASVVETSWTFAASRARTISTSSLRLRASRSSLWTIT